MLCGWLSSSVARLVVNSLPPTFSSTRSDKHLMAGGWRGLVGDCSCGKGGPVAGSAAAVAAAATRRGTLRGGLLPALPPSCLQAAARASPPSCLAVAAVEHSKQTEVVAAVVAGMRDAPVRDVNYLKYKNPTSQFFLEFFEANNIFILF